MTVKNAAYAQSLLNSITAVAHAPNWTLTGANGVFIGLLTAGVDEASGPGQTTNAFITYGGGTWGITEVVAGGGYSTGGIQLPSPTLAVANSTDILTFSASAAVWTSTGAGFTLNPGGCFIYSNDATTKFMMMQLIFTGGPYTASGGGTFTVTPAGGGLMTYTLK